MIGTILGNKYQIEEELFAQKLGSTYRAKNIAEGEPVLVVALDTGLAIEKAQLDGMLATSHRIRDIGSPTLVPTTDWVRNEDGAICLVTPLPDAVPLAVYSKGGISLGEATDLTLQVSTAMAVAAEAGLYHRDLSVHSVFVSVLGDGGHLARVVGWAHHW